MQGENKRLIWAFIGALTAAALMLVNVWQLALLLVFAAAGYILAGTDLNERARAFLRRRRS